MPEADMRKVEQVIRRLMKEYDIPAQNTDSLQDAIEEVVASENDSFLQKFTTAWGYSDLDKSKVWRYYLEA